MSSVPYNAPHIPELLSLSSFIYLLNVAESVTDKLVHAGLLGPLVLGIVWGPEVANLLHDYVQLTFIGLGYIGLLLLVFEAGLTTNVSLLYNNIMLSLVAATIGVSVPIAVSLLLLHLGYGYTLMQAFSAGAALCSTSLGTTLALLSPPLRQTRVGSVIMSAALLDDVVGLVIAAVIAQLAENSTSELLRWQTVVQPIGVSLAFTFVTPLLAWGIKNLVRWKHPKFLRLAHVQLSLIPATLMAFVAGAKYAGTSELYGAYLAGTFLAHVFPANEKHGEVPVDDLRFANSHTAFYRYIAPILATFLSPVFFASIGTALPIRSLGSVSGSQRVVWRGIVYSLLMFLSKFVVGISIWVWPEAGKRGWLGRPIKRTVDESGVEETLPTTSFSRGQGSLLLGFAMVARGEIALIVAQIARPLLMEGEDGLEVFAVVIWAILLTTIGGAVSVGFLLRSIEKRVAAKVRGSGSMVLGG